VVFVVVFGVEFYVFGIEDDAAVAGVGGFKDVLV
jgi:hypothetical protein